MLGENNITHLTVGKKTALATGLVSAMTAGQIGVFVDGSTTAQNSALTAGERFKVMVKNNDSRHVICISIYILWGGICMMGAPVLV